MTAGTRFVLNQSLFHVSSSFRCRLWQCGRSMRNTLCISHDSKRDHSLLLFMIRKPNPAYSMVSINCTIKSRCSGRKADHFLSMVACSCVSTIGSRSADSTTEKNSDTETYDFRALMKVMVERRKHIVRIVSQKFHGSRIIWGLK